MTEQERNEKLTKIKKLLALASSDPDSPEAKTAAAMAGQLMAKYNLELHQLEENNEACGVVERIEKNYIDANMKWERLLHAVIGETFPVAIVSLGGYKTVMKLGKPDRTVFYDWSFIGQKHDVELAVWFFNFLRLNISKKSERLAKSRRESYASGFIASLRTRLHELKQAQEAAVPQDKKGLVLATMALVENAVAQKYPAAKTNKVKTSTKDADAFRMGERDGKKQSLSVPISGGKGKDAPRINGKVALEQ